MLTLSKIDHIHVRVTDLKFALEWYKRVLGLIPDSRYRHVEDGHGVAMLANPSGSVRLALSQDGGVLQDLGSVAFSVSGHAFISWIDALAGERVKNKEGHPIARDSVCDHGFFYSLTFCDPFGNPYEIVSYDHTWLAGKLKLNGRPSAAL
jgi:catechol 2,3-dioxygenase-like lactoylglutathione lyase family enzyme